MIDKISGLSFFLIKTTVTCMNQTASQSKWTLGAHYRDIVIIFMICPFVNELLGTPQQTQKTIITTKVVTLSQCKIMKKALGSSETQRAVEHIPTAGDGSVEDRVLNDFIMSQSESPLTCQPVQYKYDPINDCMKTVGSKQIVRWRREADQYYKYW